MQSPPPPPPSPLPLLMPSPLFRSPSPLAWEGLFDGSETPVSLPDGSSAIPSRSVVYTAPLIESAASSSSSTATTETSGSVVEVPLAVPAAGAYALLLNHGEVPAVVVSPAGQALTPVVSEEAGHGHGHEHDDDHDHGDEDEGDGSGGGSSGAASARQWANALAASFLISLCRSVFGSRKGGAANGGRALKLGEAGGGGQGGLARFERRKDATRQTRGFLCCLM